MKRLALLIILGVVAVGLVRAHRSHTPTHWARVHHGPARFHLASFGGPRPDEPPAPPAPPGPKRKAARRVEPKPPAQPSAPAPPADPKRQPDWFPRDDAEESALAKPDARGVRVLVGSLSATEEKARQSLRRKVGDEVEKWLAGDVAPGWEPPSEWIARMTMASYVQPVAASIDDVSKDLDDVYTLHRAGARLDFSPDRRTLAVAAYNRELVRDRIVRGGAILGFVLFVLAVLAAYIRADESTKGYYTNRLRMVAAAGVGAAGVVVYRMLA